MLGASGHIPENRLQWSKCRLKSDFSGALVARFAFPVGQLQQKPWPCPSGLPSKSFNFHHGYTAKIDF
jgi:hypothetical protein